LSSGLKIDPQRLYVAGMSLGGTMCHYLASHADHPFQAMAIIDSGVPFYVINDGENYPKPPPRYFARIPLPARPCPVLINHQVDSPVWPYEGRTSLTDPAWGGFPTLDPVISPGAMASVARWTVANGLGGIASGAPPTSTSTPADFIFSTPPPTQKLTPAWQTANGQDLRYAPAMTRPSFGWPDSLATEPGWDDTLASQFNYTATPPIPEALSLEYPRILATENVTLGATPPFTVRVASGTWTQQYWRRSANDLTDEVILISLSDGGHAWPTAYSPWNADVEVFRFFETH
jgi:poly(3-hydroxybutyrate) depolymerase